MGEILTAHRRHPCQRYAGIQNRYQQESSPILNGLLMVKHERREKEKEDCAEDNGNNDSLKHWSYSFRYKHKI